MAMTVNVDPNTGTVTTTTLDGQTTVHKRATADESRSMRTGTWLSGSSPATPRSASTPAVIATTPAAQRTRTQQTAADGSTVVRAEVKPEGTGGASLQTALAAGATLGSRASPRGRVVTSGENQYFNAAGENITNLVKQAATLPAAQQEALRAMVRAGGSLSQQTFDAVRSATPSTLAAVTQRLEPLGTNPLVLVDSVSRGVTSALGPSLQQIADAQRFAGYQRQATQEHRTIVSDDAFKADVVARLQRIAAALPAGSVARDRILRIRVGR